MPVEAALVVTHKTANSTKEHSVGFRSLRATAGVHKQVEALEARMHALWNELEILPSDKEKRAVAHTQGRSGL